MLDLQKLTDINKAGLAVIIAAIVIIIGMIFLQVRRLLLAFIIGSSLASTIFSLSYMGVANVQFKGIPNYEYMAFYVPLFYGAFNVLTVALTKKFDKFKYATLAIPAIVGALHGLVFSSFGRYVLNNLPVKNFQFTENNEWQMHLYAMAYYAIIYGVVVSFLNKLYFLY